ncbi:MAG: NAD(P)-dependent oxidoreductase [Eubacteriales bacterium]|nr:NAD(P)-dependent oxidoreductase [Eubacteriales bacterium]
MDTYLVTGANGFVGKEVVRQLLNNGNNVTAIGRHKPDLNVQFIKADICDTQAIRGALQDKKFDYVFHLASLPIDTGDPYQMVNTNVYGCLNLLEEARKIKPEKFVLASSISAYEWFPATKFNAPDYLPVDEEHPCRPKDMYSVTKRMQELLIQTYYWQYKVPAVALRVTAVIGPDGKGGGQGWREIAVQLSKGERVQIPHMSASEKCHYVDIRDVARMFIAAAKSDVHGGEIFNCCGPKAVTGAEFAEIVHRYYPDIIVEYGFPWSMAQGNEIEFDMSKAKEILGYEPQFGLADSIQYLKAWIDGGNLKD